MAKTQVQPRYFALPKLPVTYANLAEWLNEGGDSAVTQISVSLRVNNRFVGEVFEISEDRVKQLKRSEHRDKIHIFVQHGSGHTTVHPYFVPWH